MIAIAFPMQSHTAISVNINLYASVVLASNINKLSA